MSKKVEEKAYKLCSRYHKKGLVISFETARDIIIKAKELKKEMPDECKARRLKRAREIITCNHRRVAFN